MVVTYPLRPTAQDTGYLKSVWETIDAASCPRAYNFHLHTLASDGKLTPVELIEQAIAIGLKGLAITDHHSVAGFKEAESYLATISLEQKKLTSAMDRYRNYFSIIRSRSTYLGLWIQS